MNHWTEEDITQWLYGLREDAGHLQECDLCRAKADRANSKRAQFLKTPAEVPSDFLAAQRRMIYQRMEARPQMLGYRLAASLALVLLVAVISFNLFHRTSYTPLATPADERLYSDLVAIDARTEPRAIEPIQSLFQE